jgi:predicted branched-subunit amino acid permease
MGNCEFLRGMKKGIPIALGYIPVSFTFGMMAVNGGMPVWVAVLISITNLTSAGQFAGLGLIICNAPLVEIGLTTFIINIRYMLMSLSLSQKIRQDMSATKRLIIAFGITDEVFAVSSLEQNAITFSYMAGLISLPFLGWSFGTLLGAVTTSMLPKIVQNSMGIALYAMFIALIVPPMKKSKAVIIVVASAIGISCIFKWMPYIKELSSGWVIIIATIAASSVGALFFPVEVEEA